MYLYINYTIYRDYITYDDSYYYCGDCQNCRWKAEWGGMYVCENKYIYIYIYVLIHQLYNVWRLCYL